MTIKEEIKLLEKKLELLRDIDKLTDKLAAPQYPQYPYQPYPYYPMYPQGPFYTTPIISETSTGYITTTDGTAQN